MPPAAAPVGARSIARRAPARASRPRAARIVLPPRDPGNGLTRQSRARRAAGLDREVPADAACVRQLGLAKRSDRPHKWDLLLPRTHKIRSSPSAETTNR